jgi:hypothetical protein
MFNLHLRIQQKNMFSKIAKANPQHVIQLALLKLYAIPSLVLVITFKLAIFMLLQFFVIFKFWLQLSQGRIIHFINCFFKFGNVIFSFWSPAS